MMKLIWTHWRDCLKTSIKPNCHNSYHPRAIMSKESRNPWNKHKKLRKNPKCKNRLKKLASMTMKKSCKKDHWSLQKSCLPSKSFFQHPSLSAINRCQQKKSEFRKKWFQKKRTPNSNKPVFLTLKLPSPNLFQRLLRTPFKSCQPTVNSNLTLKSSLSSYLAWFSMMESRNWPNSTEDSKLSSPVWVLKSIQASGKMITHPQEESLFLSKTVDNSRLPECFSKDLKDKTMETTETKFCITSSDCWTSAEKSQGNKASDQELWILPKRSKTCLKNFNLPKIHKN